MTAWQHQFVYRKETWKTTWKLRLLVLILLAVACWLSWKLSSAPIARSLICTEQTPHSDALLLENFDPDTLVFEEAAALHQAGVASRVLVPVVVDGSTGVPSVVSLGVVGLMVQVSKLPTHEIIPVHQVEPISLNAAQEIRDFLLWEKIRSVVVVSPGFRSRRSAMVYDSVFAPSGISTGCVPVLGNKTPENWNDTWHGVQDVLEQFIKLQYYRFHVLR